MNVFVADPDWGGWIVAYFFLGGIAAGCYFIAALLELVGPPEDQPLARRGYRIAFPLVLVCGVLLIVDLNRPERFWHMLLQSEVVHEARDAGWPWSAAGWQTMAYAPMLKVWSPMSIGAWAIFIFGGFSLVSYWASFRPEGRIARLLHGRWLRVPWGLVGSGVGFFVASYTGILLEATNQPFWSQTDWLGPLFLTSASSTALATLILLSHGTLADESRRRLERAEFWALGLELIVFTLLLASLRPWFPALTVTLAGWLLLVAVPVLGMLTPLLFRRGWLGLRQRPVAVALAVLAGGLLLRTAVVLTPPALLEVAHLVPSEATRQPSPAAWFSISPEDGRERGGGVGASALNRAEQLQPRTKIPDETP